MHVVERGVDEAVVIDDVIIRVLRIVNANEVRVAISNPGGGPRYQEITLRVDGSECSGLTAEGSVAMQHS